MSKKLEAAELNRQGKCIVCREVAERRTRGLCEKDYERYRRKRKLLDSESAAAWELELIEMGLLLENRQGQRVDAAEDPFSQAFDDFTAKNPKALKAVKLAEEKAEAKPDIADLDVKLKKQRKSQ